MKAKKLSTRSTKLLLDRPPSPSKHPSGSSPRFRAAMPVFKLCSSSKKGKNPSSSSTNLLLDHPSSSCDDQIRSLYMPIRACSTTRRATTPRTLAGNSCVTTLKILPRMSKSGKTKIKLVEDYDQLLAHCKNYPSTLTRLSQLPDDVISRILAFMPLKEAGQTSILSKRWRHLWSFMPYLGRFPATSSVDSYTNILNRLKSPRLEELDLYFSRMIGRSPSAGDYNSWLSLVFTRRVDHVVVDLAACDFSLPRLPVPTHTFTCVCPGFSTIKRLILRSCLFDSLACKHLTSLESLSIELMLLEGNMIEEITSSCPMLLEFEINDCNMDAPLRVSVTNPKTYKFTYFCSVPFSSCVMELHVPYVTTMIFASMVARPVLWDVPALSTVKISSSGYIFNFASNYVLTKMMKMISALDTMSEVYIGLPYLQMFEYYSNIAPPMKIKYLHIEAYDGVLCMLKGLVQFLKSSSGIETLVLNFDLRLVKLMKIKMRRKRVTLAKRLIYLDTSVTNDIEFLTKDKEKVVCLDENDNWRSLRFLLSTQHLSLKCVVINGLKKMYKSGNVWSNDPAAGVCYAVDRFEFKLVRLLLNYSPNLEKIIIKTKDVHLIDESNVIPSMKCKKVYLHEVIKQMEIPEWNKIFFSLPLCSPRAEICIN